MVVSGEAESDDDGDRRIAKQDRFLLTDRMLAIIIMIYCLVSTSSREAAGLY